MTVGELTQRLSGEELGDWATFERLHGPILIHERIDAAGGLIAATIASVFSKRGYAPTDFIPKWDAKPKPERDTLFEFMSQYIKDR
jgi:hypothetical protein